MRPIEWIIQMSFDDHLAFSLSDEGKDHLFPSGVALEGKHYETRITESAARVLFDIWLFTADLS